MPLTGATHILLIGDTPEGRTLVRAALDGVGYPLREAPDAESGLVEARRELPRLVIVDVRPPGLDGWEACRRLKSDPLTAPVPVVLVTAGRVTRQRLIDSRCDRALPRPLDPAKLREEVRRLLLQA